MRHRVSKKKLSRTKDHRKALLRNLSRSLILDGKVETTLAKAKFVKPYVEKLVTKAKKDKSIRNINLVNSKLDSTDASRKLFDEIVSKTSGRPGGYTRIIKLGFRAGDKAPMARLEWVEVESNSNEKKASTSKKDEKTKVAKVASEEKVSEDSK